ncbi:unnamed protein product [Sphagnum troendelagicum]|uniref:RBR-type E3 ubiquitin transferase n=1 Tax=Sphagnum troendelagicum TaxID=128251 RepID=A0ABP0U501_9BRYO
MESTLKLAEETSFNVTEGRTLVQKFMAMEHHEAALRALMRLATLAERKHELTVDEVEYNRQQQADEVLVLQSMFPSDFVAINQTECELSAYMINVHVDIPLNFRIVAEVPDSSGLQQEESSGTSASGRTQSSNHQHSFTIHHLPSISLLCMLPVTYPSQSPPFFTLSCLWLNSMKLSSLCHGLDKLWNEHSSGVVLHLWAEWLRQALSHVSATEKLELGPYNNGKQNGEGCNQECDARAISASTSLDADILELLQYNKEMQNKEFCESFHLCYICFSKQLGRDFIILPCQHMFCWTCLQQFSELHVREGNVINLNCPDPFCRASIPPALLKNLLTKEAFQRWEDLVLQRTLDVMPDVMYCPRCGNASIEDADHHVLCSDCFYSFCSLCRSSWHAGQTCMTAEIRLHILQDRLRSGAGGEDQRKMEQDLINEVLNLKYIMKEAKQCPVCKMAISKSQGCNKMTCTNCGNQFCFKCGHSVVGYAHFRSSDGSCSLYDLEEIAQQHMDQQQQQYQLGGHGIIFDLGLIPDFRTCPNCRQPNPKEGNNNHIYCWACRIHFCALCAQTVHRTVEHYGPRKCKQHTVD